MIGGLTLAGGVSGQDRFVISAVGILRETVDDVFSDPRGAIICLIPASFIFVVWFALDAFMPVNPDFISWSLLQGILLLNLAKVFLLAWTAVVWHRKILLQEELRSVLPPLRARVVFAYLGGTLILLLIAVPAASHTFLLLWAYVGVPFVPYRFLTLLAFVAASFPQGTAMEVYRTLLGEVTGDYLQGSSLLGVWILWLAITNLLFGAFLRLSLILPAIAVRHRLRMSEAWRGTKGHFFRLFFPLALFLNLLGIVFELTDLFVPLGLLFDLMSAGVLALVGIGVITRLYLHFFPLRSGTEDMALPAPPGADMPKP
jgi:hypothetical protein